MAELIYSALCSLDGYIEDPEGKFDWAEPDEEVHRFVNDLERGAGMHLYGRRMYETMAVWETDPGLANYSSYTGDYAKIWQSADKIVYSKTLEAVYTSRTRLERNFDPRLIGEMKVAETRDMLIGGAHLAAQAFKAGLVDECHLFLAPVIVGGGKRAFPEDVFLKLALMDQRVFGNGMVYVRYGVRS